MKISEQWLRDWISPRLSTRELAERLTLAGLEVGSVTPVAASLGQVVAGEVLAVEPHPQADRLRVCRVRIDRATTLQIVCGAANVAVGIRAAVAVPGARLPGGQEIRETEIRGVASSGMLCSAADLGLEESSDGLLILDRSAKPGTSIVDVLGLDDQILEIDLTPNRGDCLSVAGIARELAALTGARLRQPSIRAAAVRGRSRLPVTLGAGADCAVYAGRTIEGVDPQATTPWWMRERLRRAGQRAIHPVVDVTNYVMLELGQPMHAFDLEQLKGGIRVRRAGDGQQLALLDGTTRPLAPGSLVIADDQRVLALAGIMGGADSAVGPETRRIFLESAWFRPDAVGVRARQMGIQTESSQRFERGVDPTLQRRALERATALLLEIVGGRPGPVVEKRLVRHIPKRPAIGLRATRVERLLGAKISLSRCAGILRRLGLGVRVGAGNLRAVPPPYRFDLGRECDLIEEVARVSGYESLPSRQPQGTLAMPAQPESRVAVERIANLLIDRGYQEAVTYSFSDPQLQTLLDPETSAVRLRNPIASDMATMRTTLWTGLLLAVRHNQNRQQGRIRLFEIGRRFLATTAGCEEEPMLAGVVTGGALPEQWGLPGRPVDFFDIKGDVEALCALTRVGYDFMPTRVPALHPGQAAEIVPANAGPGRRIGLVGMLHPEIQARLGLNQPVFLFEVALTPLARTVLPAFREISRYPSIRRDLAVIVGDHVSAGAVLDSVRGAAGDLLADLQLFDEYRGEGIDSGRKSLALALTLRDSSRTLTEDAVEVVMGRVVGALQDRLGAKIRQ